MATTGVRYELARFCARRFVVRAVWLLVTVALATVSERLIS